MMGSLRCWDCSGGLEQAVDDFVDSVRHEICLHGWTLGVLQRDNYPRFLGFLALQVLAVFKMRLSSKHTCLMQGFPPPSFPNLPVQRLSSQGTPDGLPYPSLLGLFRLYSPS